MKIRAGDKIVYKGMTGTVGKVDGDKNTLTFRSDQTYEAKVVALDSTDITLLSYTSDLEDQNEIFKGLLGKTFHDFTLTSDTFRLSINRAVYFELEHDQDCCEQVYIESVEGDLKDLIDSPLTMAEVVSNDGEGRPKPSTFDDVDEWTFYKFATVKGYVTIRFYGTSNGYYSMGVSLKTNIDTKESV